MKQISIIIMLITCDFGKYNNTMYKPKATARWIISLWLLFACFRYKVLPNLHPPKNYTEVKNCWGKKKICRKLCVSSKQSECFKIQVYSKNNYFLCFIFPPVSCLVTFWFLHVIQNKWKQNYTTPKSIQILKKKLGKSFMIIIGKTFMINNTFKNCRLSLFVAKNIFSKTATLCYRRTLECHVRSGRGNMITKTLGNWSMLMLQ